MENARRHGSTAPKQGDWMEDMENLTANGLDVIQQALSQGNIVITEPSVIFLFNLEWETAREMACQLMGPEAIKKAESGSHRPYVIRLCETQEACEVLSTKLNASELVMVLKSPAFKSMNLLPIIIPTEATMVTSYIEISGRSNEL